MKLGSTVAASLFSAIFLASAQSPPPVTVSVQQGVSGPTSGLATLSISNTSQKTITAIAFVGDPVDVPASKAGVRITVSPLKIYDAATEPRAARPIAPGQLVAIAVPFPSRDASVPPTVRAVLFVDGTSWGDLAWANRLANRRALMEKALTDAISDLRGALDAGATREALINTFASALTTGVRSAFDPDEPACISSVRETVLKNLQNVRQTAAGVPISVPALVNHELQSLIVRLATLLNGGLVR